MLSKLLHQRFAKLVVMLLLITGFLSLTVPISTARAGQSDPTFIIKISQLKGPVCVGESRVVTVTWEVNDSGGDMLVPLTGPPAIYAKVRNGALDRYTYHPGPTFGTTTFTYTAEKEGSELIEIKAMDFNLEADGQDDIQFDVKKCDFRFSLYAQLDNDSQAGDAQMSLRYVVRAKGLLKATDPANPRVYEARDVYVILEGLVTSFSLPDCMIPTLTPGSGDGFDYVRAEQIEGSNTMTLQFAPPENLDWNIDMVATCAGQSSTYNANFPLSSAHDPWIEAIFPEGQGSQNVELDMFELGVKNFNQSKHNNAVYTAIVTLTRVVSK